MRWIRTKRWDQEIARRDPKQDAQEIVSILANWVFPLEILVAMELAQLRTFSIPSISQILHATREYECRGVKRLDDTRAIMIEIFRYAHGSDEQQEMIDHLNAIHSLYCITNDDYLYVLTTFMFDPGLFIERFGFRGLKPREWDAFFYLYQDLGERMGIKEIPQTRQEMWAWRCAYEDEHQCYHAANEAVARGFLASVREVLPPPLRPFGTLLPLALIDDHRLLKSLGLTRPSKAWETLVVQGLKQAGRISKVINPFQEKGVEHWPSIYENYPTYPNGYERLQLGPARVLELLRRRRRHTGADRTQHVTGERANVPLTQQIWEEVTRSDKRAP